MKIIALLVASVAVSSPLMFQAQQPGRPTGQTSPAEILDKYLAATGGVEARRKLSTVSASGDFGFNLGHPLGTYNFYYKAPSRDVLEVQMTSHGISWVGHYDGQLVRRHTVEGVDMINGAGMQIVEQDWMCLLESDYKERYSRIDLVGLEQVAHRWAYALRFTPRAGDPQVRYYDAESFLLVRLDQVQRFRDSKKDRQLAYKIESYFYDYRDIAGIKLPSRMAVSRDNDDLTFDIPTVKTDVDIADSIFSEHMANK